MIALVYLQYGIYDSPAISFLTQRIHVILTSEIAEGATGIVHGAMLEVQTVNGTTLANDVVDKLALLDEQSFRSAFSIKAYGGIPRFGEDGPSLLIMTHAFRRYPPSGMPFLLLLDWFLFHRKEAIREENEIYTIGGWPRDEELLDLERWGIYCWVCFRWDIRWQDGVVRNRTEKLLIRIR